MALQTVRRTVSKHYPLLFRQATGCGRPSGDLSRPEGWASVITRRSINSSALSGMESLAPPVLPSVSGVIMNEQLQSAFSSVIGLPGSLWLSSVIKKRKKKMNKHKLRKLRKKNRYKNKK